MAGISGVGRSGVKWNLNNGHWRLQNIEGVTANINKELMKMELKSGVGLSVAAAEILASAEKTPPLVPVDTGNLRNSTFVNPPKKDKATSTMYVTFGYSAGYAAAVHEMLQSISGAPINWTRPGSGPRFFVASLKRNAKRIVSTIKRYM